MTRTAITRPKGSFNFAGVGSGVLNTMQQVGGALGLAILSTVALNAEHVWAPETIWDPAGQQFMVYWSTPIDNNASASDPPRS